MATRKLHLVISLTASSLLIVGALVYGKIHATQPVTRETIVDNTSAWSTSPDDVIVISATATKQQIEDTKNYQQLLKVAKKCVKYRQAYDGFTIGQVMSWYYMNFSQDEKTCIFAWRQNLVKQQQDSLEGQSANWPIYTSSKLGISLKYPKQAAGDDVVFYQAGKMLIMTTKSSDLYLRRNVLQQLTDDKEIFRKYNEIKKQDTHTFPNAAWIIWIRDINSDNDLEKLIQDKFSIYYEGKCKLGPKSTTTQEGIYDVAVVPTIEGPAPDLYGPESSCWINWMTVFKYSPKYKRAVTWDIGQEYMFTPNKQVPCPANSECDDSGADKIIADSLKFTQQSP